MDQLRNNQWSRIAGWRLDQQQQTAPSARQWLGRYHCRYRTATDRRSHAAVLPVALQYPSAVPSCRARTADSEAFVLTQSISYYHFSFCRRSALALCHFYTIQGAVDSGVVAVPGRTVVTVPRAAVSGASAAVSLRCDPGHNQGGTGTAPGLNFNAYQCAVRRRAI